MRTLRDFHRHPSEHPLIATLLVLLGVAGVSLGPLEAVIAGVVLIVYVIQGFLDEARRAEAEQLKEDARVLWRASGVARAAVEHQASCECALSWALVAADGGATCRACGRVIVDSPDARAQALEWEGG